MKQIIIFASGSGTNAERIINYFSDSKDVKIHSIFCNNPNAFVIERAKKFNIPITIFSKDQFYENETILKKLLSINPNLIVLAGFLWLIPSNIINSFKNKIINIHPALLPKYGGKGMYGEKIHREVLSNNEKESGITIHKVNEKYDQGDIIFQKKCIISEEDTIDTLAKKIHILEYIHFPLIIKNYLN